MVRDRSAKPLFISSILIGALQKLLDFRVAFFYEACGLGIVLLLCKAELRLYIFMAIYEEFSLLDSLFCFESIFVRFCSDFRQKMQICTYKNMCKEFFSYNKILLGR